MNGKSIILFLLLNLVLVISAADRDFYKILGVSKTATKEEIKKAYKILSKKHHPDKNPNNREASEKLFIECSEAYQVLTNEDKRRIYDRYGEAGLKDEGRGNFQNSNDIFERFFGGGGARQHAEKKGPEIKMELLVTLEELYKGNSFDMELNKQILCPVCRGSGAKDPNDVHTCNSCGGNGIKIVRRMLAPGMYQQSQQVCNTCAGKGKISKSKCPHCQGKKVKRGTHEITVTIERGMPDGHTIVYEREGDQSPDYSSGDLTFTIVTQPHDFFTRVGDNLYCKISITLRESLIGFEKKIKHLDGTMIMVKRDKITPSGFVQIIKKQGMPDHEFPSEFGNLYVEYLVVFPASLTGAQQEVVKANFESTSHDEL